MNKMSKIYMDVAMITSILIFLFGLYFSTKGIVEVTYESWRAMGVSCLAFLLALFSMMKLPFHFLINFQFPKLLRQLL